MMEWIIAIAISLPILVPVALYVTDGEVVNLVKKRLPRKKPAPHPLTERRAHCIEYVKGEIELMNAWEEAFNPTLVAADTKGEKYEKWHNEEIYRRWWLKDPAIRNPMMDFQSYLDQMPPGPPQA